MRGVPIGVGVTAIFMLLNPVIFILVIVLIVRMGAARWKYKGHWSGPFFFDGEELVVNTGIPVPIPMEEIDHVELRYNQREVERHTAYSMWVRVVRRNGKVKRAVYQGSRMAQLPRDWQAMLEEKGIRVVMTDGQ